MVEDSKRIIVKKGFKSFTYDQNTFKYKLYEKENLFLIKANYTNFYNFYSIEYYRSQFNLNFEMIISKEETEICDLLDTLDYSNFLIAKQLIKSKLKIYG